MFESMLMTPKAVAGGGNDSYTQLLLHGDGNLTDSSQNAFVPVASGTAAASTAQKKFGTGSIFVPNGSAYLTTNGGSKLTLGATDFTLEFWLFLTSSSYTFSLSNTQRSLYGVVVMQSGTIYCSTNGSSWTSSGSTGITADSIWHHLALSRQGSAARIFKDGVLMNTLAVGASAIYERNPGVLVLGDSTGLSSAGYFDEVRFSAGIARYTANFTPPTIPYS